MLDTGQLQLKGDALLCFKEGLALAAAGAYQQAVGQFTKVVSLCPDFYEAWYEQGLALEKAGCYAEAIVSFDRALNLHPGIQATCQILLEQGNALQYGLGDYTAALACYDQILQLELKHELAWHNRGNALLYGLNRLVDALGCYNQVIEINPASDLAWRNRGTALVEMGCYEEAIASYERAIEVNPQDELSWQARTLAAQKSGLNYRQPTTAPVWHCPEHGESTFIEGDTDGGQVTPTEVTTVLSGKLALVVEDDWGKREIILEQEQYEIGRDPQSDICLHSQFVSRQHAVLTRVYREDGSYHYQIIDGNLDGKLSTNGLLINGQKLRTRVLKPEDVIVFGPKVQATYKRLLNNLS